MDEKKADMGYFSKIINFGKTPIRTFQSDLLYPQIGFSSAYHLGSSILRLEKKWDANIDPYFRMMPIDTDPFTHPQEIREEILASLQKVKNNLSEKKSRVIKSLPKEILPKLTDSSNKKPNYSKENNKENQIIKKSKIISVDDASISRPSVQVNKTHVDESVKISTPEQPPKINSDQTQPIITHEIISPSPFQDKSSPKTDNDKDNFDEPIKKEPTPKISFEKISKETPVSITSSADSINDKTIKENLSELTTNTRFEKEPIPESSDKKTLKNGKPSIETPFQTTPVTKSTPKENPFKTLPAEPAKETISEHHKVEHVQKGPPSKDFLSEESLESEIKTLKSTPLPSATPPSPVRDTEHPSATPPSPVRDTEHPSATPPSPVRDTEHPSATPPSPVRDTEHPSATPPSPVRDTEHPSATPPSPVRDTEHPSATPPSPVRDTEHPSVMRQSSPTKEKSTENLSYSKSKIHDTEKKIHYQSPQRKTDSTEPIKSSISEKVIQSSENEYYQKVSKYNPVDSDTNLNSSGKSKIAEKQSTSKNNESSNVSIPDKKYNYTRGIPIVTPKKSIIETRPENILPPEIRKQLQTLRSKPKSKIIETQETVPTINIRNVDVHIISKKPQRKYRVESKKEEQSSEMTTALLNRNYLWKYKVKI